jgi:hypothetical protein
MAPYKKKGDLMVKSVKTGTIDKKHVQDVASALLHIMHSCADRRDSFIKTPESDYYNYSTFGYEKRSFGISDISYLRVTNARLVLDTICRVHNLNWFKSYIPYFSGSTCKEMILAYIGAKYYWRDYYNRFKSIGAYGESLVGTEISVKGLGVGYTRVTVVDWHRTSYQIFPGDKEPAQFSLLLDVMHGKEYKTGIRLDVQRNVRDQIKCYTRAFQEDTIKWGPNGIYQYPAHYLLDMRIGRELIDSDYYRYSRLLSGDSPHLGRIASYRVLGVEPNLEVEYTLSSGKTVFRYLPPNMYKEQ